MQEKPSEDRYIVKLDVFEGPLDLLLHLIRQHEINIFDIPISFITQKYLEYLDLMQVLNLDLASDYLEMAAHLTFIKSKMMLPVEPTDQEEDEDDGPDPREELVRRLLEYQKYKTAANELGARPRLGDATFPRGSKESVAVDRELANPGLFKLLEAFQKLLKDADIDPTQEISVSRISISDKIHELLDFIKERNRVALEELFLQNRSRPQLVVTFLALLEMTKLGLTTLLQPSTHGELYITVTSTTEEDGVPVLPDFDDVSENESHFEEDDDSANELGVEVDASVYSNIEQDDGNFEQDDSNIEQDDSNIEQDDSNIEQDDSNIEQDDITSIETDSKSELEADMETGEHTEINEDVIPNEPSETE